jgi:peptidoglycan/LPS O-acetylase OafA/YrhL
VTDPSRPPGYKPEFDSIRAIAILLVLFFHTQSQWFAWLQADGGFLGVDVFFVLSGFLITSLLVNEFSETGSISARTFYARRALRLLPALALALTVGALVTYRYGNAAGNMPYPHAALATLLFSANWFSAKLGALTPMWALGLEEQYYLLWPGVLWIALRRGVRPLWLAAMSAAGAVTVAAVRSVAYHSSTAPDSWGPMSIHGWTRADGVFIGSALALIMASSGAAQFKVLLRSRPLASAAAVCAGALLVRADLHDRTTYDGIFLLNCCTALIIGHLFVDARSPASRVIRMQPLPSIGRISYGLYIFQGPMIVVGSQTSIRTLSVVVMWTGTFVLAIASYFVVERPALALKSRLVRRGVRRRRTRGGIPVDGLTPIHARGKDREFP